jgi:hypothetical protein
MNRDESLQRPVAIPPQIAIRGDRVAVFPSESEGGSWLGVNDAGICVALINWYAVARSPCSGRVSRGIVVPALLKAAGIEEARQIARDLTKRDLAPFRLLAFAPRERVANEFRWNHQEFYELTHAWEPRHWFSSAHDERQAQLERSRVARAAWREAAAGRLPWLRRLHASHKPGVGPLCFCMHRKDAATVSYTEVVVTGRAATLRYHDGPLCRVPQPVTTHRISLTVPCKESGLIPTNQETGHIHENQQHSIQSSRRSLLPGGVSSRHEVLELTD